ncbi:BTAD domain-containing putative transcriptional regulator [Bacillus sp. SG-1]|uniref:BTAD domain-containing putative transcriptional regulator n=1 Tax=Bacillus sp. SG-1 TaxID=161544 RepID=UPI0001543A7F|nr:hypothetical protein [Bacillus sp. SG-1]EDL65589.1 regulatory protein, LuxR [Bacillus sp. SG-1]
MIYSTVLSVKEKILVRERLFLKLNKYPTKKVIALTGGTGYGKTSLISSYILQQKIEYLWYSIDRSSNNLSELIHTIEQDIQNIRGNIQISGSHLIKEKISSSFIDNKDSLWIVIDGMDILHINDEEIRLFVSYMSQFPSTITFVLIGRRLPSTFPTSRMKLQGDLLHLTQKDLALTKDETQTLLRSIYHVNLSDYEIERSYNEMEGWPAGITLFAGIIKEYPMLEREKFVEHLHESEDISHYLANEIIGKLPKDLQTFLYYCSLSCEIEREILKEFQPDVLVDQWIDTLKSLQLFLYEGSLGNYRLHELIRRFLYKKMEEEWGKAKVVLLHKDLANLYKKKYRFIEAFSQFLAAGEDVLAVEMIKHMAERYESEQFLRLMNGWLEKWSPSLNLSQISLFLFRATPINHTKKLIEPLKISLERNENKSKSTLMKLQHRLATIYFYAGNLEKALVAYKESLGFSYETNDVRMIALNTSMIAQTYRFMNEEEKALSLAKEALAMAEMTGFEQAQMHALWTLSEVMMNRGQIEKGRRFAEQAIDVSTKCDQAAVVYPYCSMSTYFLKIGNIEKALEWCNRALLHAEKFGIQADMAWVFMGMAVCYEEMNKINIAEKYLLKAEKCFKNFNYLHCIVQMRLIEVLLKQEKLKEACVLIENANSTIKEYEYEWLKTRKRTEQIEGRKPIINVKMMGSLVITINDEPIKIKRKSSLRLFLLFLVHYGKRWSKEEIIGKLFPDESEEAASNQFYVALSVLRKTLEPNLKSGRNSKYIEKESSWYKFNEESINFDLKELETILLISPSTSSEQNLNEILSNYKGDLLEEYLYEEFISQRRDEVRELFLNRIKSYAIRYQNNKPETAIFLYDYLIKIDPYDEQNYKQYIQLLANHGYKGKAKKIGLKAIDALEKDLGIPIKKEIDEILAACMLIEDSKGCT